jgi:hypothetical protein
MTAYEITLKDQARERIDGADAYAQEGQLTTFFRTASARQVVDCWSVRLASFRTTEIMAVRRLEDPTALDHAFTVDHAFTDDLTTAAGLRSA